MLISTTNDPNLGSVKSFNSTSSSKITPNLLPNAILATASKAPPPPIAYADLIIPSLISFVMRLYTFFTSEYIGRLYASVGIQIRIRRFPALLSSGVITSVVFATSTAKDTSVGGTSISLNVPDMESFPPMDGSPKPICAL